MSFARDVTRMAMLYCSDPHKTAAQYRQGLTLICNAALKEVERHDEAQSGGTTAGRITKADKSLSSSSSLIQSGASADLRERLLKMADAPWELSSWNEIQTLLREAAGASLPAQGETETQTE